MPIVTLTTDFGHSDYYVGAMKGAILRVAPTAQLIDISHQIPPQDILAAAFTLRHAACEFPPRTTHLAVVDPGVGTQRRPLAFKADDQTWVGRTMASSALSSTGPRGQSTKLTAKTSVPRNKAALSTVAIFLPP